MDNDDPFAALPDQQQGGSDPFAALPDAVPEQAPQDPFAALPDATSVKPAQQQQQDLHVNKLTGETVDFNNPYPNGFMSGVGESLNKAAQSFNDKLDIFNRGFERYALGGLQLANDLPIVGQFIPSDEKLAAANQQGEAQYQAAYARTPSPVVDFLGRSGGATVAGAPAMMAATAAGPLGAVGTSLQAAGGGLMSGMVEYADSPLDRLKKGATSGLLSGAVTGGIFAGSAIINNLLKSPGVSSIVEKIVTPKKAAAKDIANAVKLDQGNNADDALAAVQAVKKDPNLENLTPGEALGAGKSELGKGKVQELEGSIQLDEGSKGAIAANVVPKTQELKKQIQQTIDDLAPADTVAIKAKAKAATADEYILPDGTLSKGAPPASTNYTLDIIKNNPTLSKKYNQIVNSSDPKISGLPRNSVPQLAKLEKELRRDIFGAKKVPDFSSLKMQELEYAQKTIRKVLDQSENFVTVMKASEKLHAKEMFDEALSKVRTQAGHDDLTLDQMYRAVASTEFAEETLLKKIAATADDPEAAVSQASKMLELANKVRKSPTWKVLQNEELMNKSVSGPAQQILKNFAENFTMKRYYHALADITTSGASKWAPQLEAILGAKSVEAQKGLFMSLMTEAMKQAPYSALRATTDAMASKMIEPKKNKYGVQKQ